MSVPFVHNSRDLNLFSPHLVFFSVLFFFFSSLLATFVDFRVLGFTWWIPAKKCFLKKDNETNDFTLLRRSSTCQHTARGWTGLRIVRRRQWHRRPLKWHTGYWWKCSTMCITSRSTRTADSIFGVFLQLYYDLTQHQFLQGPFLKKDQPGCSTDEEEPKHKQVSGEADLTWAASPATPTCLTLLCFHWQEPEMRSIPATTTIIIIQHSSMNDWRKQAGIVAYRTVLGFTRGTGSFNIPWTWWIATVWQHGNTSTDTVFIDKILPHPASVSNTPPTSSR